jgi:TonB family protein
LIEATKQCEGQVIDQFPLRQYLGATDHSTVFLTERDRGQKAAIKFVPVEGDAANRLLSAWKRAAQLSHPHLLKIFESGRCQLGGRNQVYVVMEYADENLSEILPQRALTTAEAKDMLSPLLDCLAYLHSGGFLHGNLRPANIMAANNQLKLASDSIRQAGESYATGKKVTRYDAPESGTGTLSASADVWSLGITLVEVLTQRVPDWETRGGEPVIPALPEPLREFARNCLKRDPNARWTVPQIKVRLSLQQPAQQQPSPPPIERVAVQATHRRSALPLVLGMLLVLAIIGATLLFRHRAPSPSSSSSQLAPPKAEQMAAIAKPDAAQGKHPSASLGASAGQGDVVRQVPPKISPSAQRTIQGRIKIRVRVHVDRAGDVTRTDLVSAGPSRYFAHAVVDAAKQWKFVPASQSGERRWMLQFELTRSGNSAHVQK